MKKEKRISVSLSQLLLLFMFFWTTPIINAQDKLEVYAGIGTFELYHIGGNYQFNRISAGVSVGLSYDESCTDITLSGNFYYYMFGDAKRSEKYPWFSRLGITHVSTDENDGQSTFNVISPRIGREFYLFNSGGIRADAGINYCFYTTKNDAGNSFMDENTVSPALSIVFFYRF